MSANPCPYKSTLEIDRSAGQSLDRVALTASDARTQNYASTCPHVHIDAEAISEVARLWLDWDLAPARRDRAVAFEDALGWLGQSVLEHALGWLGQSLGVSTTALRRALVDAWRPRDRDRESVLRSIVDGSRPAEPR